jgi:FkbM family methyltransferase
MILNKKIINKFFKIFDIKILKISRNPNFVDLLIKFINNFEINYVIDVGANVGQFATELRFAGYKKNILSIEPIEEAYQKLLDKSKKDKFWSIYQRCCLGEKKKLVDINISKNLQSSSILNINNLHLLNRSESRYIGAEKVQMITFDDLFNSRNDLFDKNILLKLDVQGYEDKIILGARESIKKIRALLLELSLVELYDGQSLWIDVINNLQAIGFEPWIIDRGFSAIDSGRTLQIDLMLLNKKN